MVPSRMERAARISALKERYRTSHRLPGSRPRRRFAAANVDSGAAGPPVVLLDEPAAMEHAKGATDVAFFFVTISVAVDPPAAELKVRPPTPDPRPPTPSLSGGVFPGALSVRIKGRRGNQCVHRCIFENERPGRQVPDTG